MSTVMIYLIGLSGTGKYTIAQHIAHHGYKIVDNHLINNPIFSMINLDGVTPIPRKVWETIGKIRSVVFDFIASDHTTNFVLTNELLEYEHALYNRVMELANKRDSLFIPVKFAISNAEHIRRITSPGRAERFKLTSAEEVDKQKTLITISHPNLCELDVTSLTAQEAAQKILVHVEKIQKDLIFGRVCQYPSSA